MNDNSSIVLAIALLLAMIFLFAHMFIDSARSDALKERVTLLEAKANGQSQHVDKGAR